MPVRRMWRATESHEEAATVAELLDYYHAHRGDYPAFREPLALSRAEVMEMASRTFHALRAMPSEPATLPLDAWWRLP